MKHLWLLVLVSICGCDLVEESCGPSSAIVIAVVDGDTIDLDSGERVRYLLIDTPELSRGDCYAPEARDRNAELVLGQRVELSYDLECRDDYDRLLAYVRRTDVDINRTLVDEGLACSLSIPPNGSDRGEEFVGLEARARSEGRGMWGACSEVACAQ